MKRELRPLLGFGLAAALILGIGLGDPGANAMGKRRPGEEAPASLEDEVRGFVQGTLDKIRESASYEDFAASGYTPEDVFANVRDRKSPEAAQALCNALLAIPAEDMAQFAALIDDRAKSGFLPCADALGTRLLSFRNDARLRLSREHGHRFAALGRPETLTTPVTLPSREVEIDPGKQSALFRGDLKPGQIAITLDDGPHPTRTAKILAVLKAAGVRATFFEVGQMAKAHPELSKAVADAGHTVGSHSWSHPQLPRLSLDHAEQEIRAGRDQVALSAGVAVPFFRFPYGAKSAALLEFTKKEGLASFFWNMDSEDWKRPDPNNLFAHVIGELNREKGGIILFHDIQAQTVDALPHVFEELKKRNFETIVSVPH